MLHQNPFDGISPDVTVLGVEFNGAWAILLGALWGLGFVWFAFKMIGSLMAVRDARQHSNVADYAAAFSGVKLNGIALLILGLLPAIFAAIDAVTGA